MGFYSNFIKHLDVFVKTIATEENEWIVKGFIDVFKRVYPMTSDTKVVSKIIELMIFPEIISFGRKYNYEVIPAEHQNHYPDISFKSKSDDELIAVDIKSSYRKSSRSISGMTLGAFTGYFRSKGSTKNITFPYDSYSSHYVLGVIYTRNESSLDKPKSEMITYDLESLAGIPSVVSDFKFFLQEKWRISSDKPGSGNTKNIGSINNINRLVKGKGTFEEVGKEVFKDYWRNYMTKDMAKAIDSEVPYNNLEQYLEWKQNVDLPNSTNVNSESSDDNDFDQVELKNL